MDCEDFLEGGGLVPEFCFSTAKLTTGIQYSEGQEVTFNAHNQVANFTVEYTEDQTRMGFSKHIFGIRWKILAIMWCKKHNLIANAGEPVFVLWSEHITEWDNSEVTQVTQVHVTYPRWKFVPESRIKAIMTTPIVELSEEQNRLKTMSLRVFCPDPEDPKADEILAKQKKARRAELDEKCRSEVAGPMSSERKRKLATTPKGKSAKRGKINSTARLETCDLQPLFGQVGERERTQRRG